MLFAPPRLCVSRLTAGQGDRDRSQQPLSRPRVCPRHALFFCPCCRISLGRSLCGCVCWGTALLVTLWGLPGPDAPADSDFAYKDVVTAIINSAQVGVGLCGMLSVLVQLVHVLLTAGFELFASSTSASACSVWPFLLVVVAVCVLVSAGACDMARTAGCGQHHAAGAEAAAAGPPPATRSAGGAVSVFWRHAAPCGKAAGAHTDVSRHPCGQPQGAAHPAAAAGWQLSSGHPARYVCIFLEQTPVVPSLHPGAQRWQCSTHACMYLCWGFDLASHPLQQRNP